MLSAPFRAGLSRFVPEKLRRRNITRIVIEKKTAGLVIAGSFKGMRYVSESIGSRLYPKLLGTYELELANVIEELCGEAFSTIINVGAAEGYYAVGFAVRCPNSTVIAYETEPEGRRLLEELANLNSVRERIQIRGTCDHEALSRVLTEHQEERCLLLVDIEGAEDRLLDPKQVPELRRCTILVEVHDGRNDRPIGSNLIKKFESSHQIARLWARSRTSTAALLPPTDRASSGRLAR